MRISCFSCRNFYCYIRFKIYTKSLIILISPNGEISLVKYTTDLWLEEIEVGTIFWILLIENMAILAPILIDYIKVESNRYHNFEMEVI